MSNPNTATAVTVPASDGAPKSRKAFIPLECNPEVMTNLIHKLGVSKKLAFHDVFSIDDPDLLAFIPRPAYALLLVLPISKKYENVRIEEDASRPVYDGSGVEEPVVWFRQTIKNACGMMGVLHGVSNGEASNFIKPGSDLSTLLSKAIPLSPAQRAELLETSAALEQAHQSAASKGATQAPDAEAEVDLHYICFVKSTVNNHLYELDGGRKGPLDRGLLEPEQDVLSEPALELVKAFIEREKGENISFSLVALAPALE